MKRQLNMDKIATALGAERRGTVSATAGYFGAMQLLADIEVRFRVPVGGPALAALAALPILLLVAGVALEVRSRAIGLPGVLVAAGLAAIGPAVYAALVERRARRRASALMR